MKRATLCLILGATLGACQSSRAPLAPIAAALLAFAAEAGRELGEPPAEEGAARAALRALVERARSVRDRVPGDGDADPIARVLLDEQAGIRPDLADPSIERALLSRVLAERRGSCLGLSGVYLAVAGELELPSHGVIAPGHFLVRRGERALELLEGGRPISRAELRRRYSAPAENPLYLRALSSDETLAAFRYNLANALRERRRPRDAVRHYLRVLEVLPDLAEAHQNLGLAYLRLGEHRLAERAFLRTASLNPNARGLRGNLEAVRAASRRDARP